MQQMILLQILLLAQHVSVPLCPSSGAREYYTDGCCLWYLVLWFLSCRYGMELRVICPVENQRTIWNRTRDLPVCSVLP